MSERPGGWIEAPFEMVVEILDSDRVPLNATERERRVKGNPSRALFPYYGATGQVGEIDDFIFDEPLILLGEDGVPFFDRLRHKAYLVEGKCWVNNHAHVLRAIDAAVDRRYLAAYLNVFDYRGFVTGTTRLKLTQAAMRSIPVPIAPLPEQKRIADKLDALLARVDTCRSRLDRLPGIIKRFRQSVLAAATSGELTREWREDRGRDIAGWEAANIADLVDGKPRNGYSPRAVEAPTAVKSLTLTATTTGTFRGEHFKYVGEEIPGDSHLWLVPGDILIQRANTIEYVGVSAVFDGPRKTFIYPDLMMKCRANSRVITPFLHCLLSSEKVRTFFRENATGTAGNMPKINQQTVLAAPAVLPPLDEQREIVRRTEELLRFADQLSSRCLASRKLADAITPSALAKAFRGELVPQNPNDEPASELLARLRARPESSDTTRKPKRGTRAA